MTCTQDHKIINCDLGPLTWDPGPTQIRIFVISWTHNSKCVMVYQIESFKSWYKSINGFWSYRNSHPEVFLGKLVLKICSKFTGEHPCWSAKLLCNFIEVALRHGCSPVNLLHIFRTCFLKNTSGWLPLELTIIISIISKTKLITTKNNCINKDKISKSQIKVGKIKIPFKLFNPYTCSNHQPWSA